MSQHWDILSGIKTTLAALPAFAAIPIRIRKRLFFSSDHGDAYPLVCLAPETEQIANETTPNVAWIDYPVLVALFQQVGATLQKESELQWQIDRRDEVRLALWKKGAPGVAAVFDANYEPAPIFDLAGLEKLHDVSVQRFTYRHSGARST
jgi:hypothetical protein